MLSMLEKMAVRRFLGLRKYRKEKVTSFVLDDILNGEVERTQRHKMQGVASVLSGFSDGIPQYNSTQAVYSGFKAVSLIKMPREKSYSLPWLGKERSLLISGTTKLVKRYLNLLPLKEALPLLGFDASRDIKTPTGLILDIAIDEDASWKFSVLEIDSTTSGDIRIKVSIEVLTAPLLRSTSL
jgi:hypothetical protein